MRNLVLIAVTAAAGLAAAPIDKKDVEYGRPGGHALLLDLHIPDGPGPFPAAILVHGGGFDGGSKSTNCRPLFEPLANANFAWFSIDYRMAPEFRFPEAKDDMASAIRWVKANAREYHVDVSKIAIIGESAGGFLVNYAGTHETPETQGRRRGRFLRPGGLRQARAGAPRPSGALQYEEHQRALCQWRQQSLLRRGTTRRSWARQVA